MRESVTLKITSADTMTYEEIKSAAAWLKAQADALLVNRSRRKDYYDRIYTARYYTDDTKER